MFIALTLKNGDLTLINLNEIEQICFDLGEGSSGKEAMIFLKNDPNSPIRLADTMMDIVKGLVSAGQIIKPLN
jgi:hypothetical protein